MKKTILGTVGCALALLAACGGGGGGGGGGNDFSGPQFNGNSSPASISSGNVSPLGQTAGESVRQMAASTGLPLSAEIEIRQSGAEIEPVIYDFLESLTDKALLSSLPLAVTLDISSELCISGSAIADADRLEEGRPASIKYDFRQCRSVSGGQVITSNGRIEVRFSRFGDDNSPTTVRYRNFTVTPESGEPVTLNLTFSCPTTDLTPSCTLYSDFAGSDGKVHRVSDFSISGSASSGYFGNARLSHNDHGTISLNYSNIRFGDCGSLPESGDITFFSSRTSGTISFSNDPCSVSGTWNDGAASGTF